MTRVYLTEAQTQTEYNRTSAGRSDSRSSGSVWTNIDGVIGNTEQMANDCWLLSILNSLRDTDWGREAVKNAIKPDGKGGAIVTFHLDNGKTKDIHIKYKEIVRAQENGDCAIGDDDVAAFELAYEKLTGNKDGGSYYDKEAFIKMICGNVSSYFTTAYDMRDIDSYIKEIERNPNKYSVTLGFEYTSKDSTLVAHHAYQIQRVSTNLLGKKYIYLINPWDSSEPVKVPLSKIKKCSPCITVFDKSADNNDNFKASYEKDYEEAKRHSAEVLEQKTKTRDRLLGEANDIMAQLDAAINTYDYKTIKKAIQALDKINPYNIIYMFYEDSIITSNIERLDKALKLSSWLNIGRKKTLMNLFIEPLLNYAKYCGVDDNIIEETRKTCKKSFSLFGYKKENIISALQNLRRYIFEKRNPFSDPIDNSIVKKHLPTNPFERWKQTVHRVDSLREQYINSQYYDDDQDEEITQ